MKDDLSLHRALKYASDMKKLENEGRLVILPEGDSKMNKIAKFEKVSFEQFREDWYKAFGNMCENISEELKETNIRNCYDSIILPKRSTVGSAGYDMFLPFNLDLSINDYQVIPTGIRCKMEDGWVLKVYPRSGHGFKYGVHLANTVGIIDSDYYNADNEGHIQIKLVNDSMLKKSIELKADTAFCQGIFLPFGITVDDEVEEKRKGGFGSTDNK